MHSFNDWFSFLKIDENKIITVWFCKTDLIIKMKL